ncbi:hypothetical protein [Streptomyces sp. NPDC093544]|uniref:hypothetical protein n=1 Tax=Streptomyces sp. NPDC093544 TaxID=3155200 RepID=UPI003435770D
MRVSVTGVVAGGEYDEVVHELAVRPGRAAHEYDGVEVAAPQLQCVVERVVVMGEEIGFGGRSRPWGVLFDQQSALFPAGAGRPQQGAAVPPGQACCRRRSAALRSFTRRECSAMLIPYGLYSCTSSTSIPCRAQAAAICTVSVPSSYRSSSRNCTVLPLREDGAVRRTWV